MVKKELTDGTPVLRNVSFCLYGDDPLDEALHAIFKNVRKRQLSNFIKQVLYFHLCDQEPNGGHSGPNGTGIHAMRFLVKKTVRHDAVGQGHDVPQPISTASLAAAPASKPSATMQMGPPPLTRRVPAATSEQKDATGLTSETAGLRIIETADAVIPVENEDQDGSMLSMIG